MNLSFYWLNRTGIPKVLYFVRSANMVVVCPLAFFTNNKKQQC